MAVINFLFLFLFNLFNLFYLIFLQYYIYLKWTIFIHMK